MRRLAPRMTALFVVVALYALARPIRLPDEQAAAMAAGFGFARLPLLDAEVAEERSLRAVNPSLQRIQAWVSAEGSAVALHDLDANGAPDDLCRVETRVDRVLVAPVPGTGERYAPFSLDADEDPAVAPMGCLPNDLNEDGWADLLVYYWGRPPRAFLRRGEHAPLGRGAFVPHEIVRPSERWYTNAAAFADIDGDGHFDLILGNYFGDGARVLDAEAGDSVEMQASWGRGFNGGRNRILLWSGLGPGEPAEARFTEAADALSDTVAHAWTLALGAADLDGDMLPEIYFANDFGPDRLLHNRSHPGRTELAELSGRRGPTTPGSKVLGHDSFKGMGVDFGDVNGDGLLDIFVSNISAEFSLFESHFLFESTGEVSRMWEGVAPYVDRSQARGVARGGWGWDAKFGDFDNDGVAEVLQATGFLKGDTDRWPELHELATANDALIRDPSHWPRFRGGDDVSGWQHNPFYVRGVDGRYHDLAPALGLDAPQVTRGIATADVDGDGSLDFAVGNQWEDSFFHHNRARDPGRFLGLRLLLPSTGRVDAGVTVMTGRPPLGGVGTPAIGASVALTLPDGRTLVGQVDGGNGHSGVRSPELHFGLGRWDAGATVDCTVRWRDRRGGLHRRGFALAPGWHTILLGDDAEDV